MQMFKRHNCILLTWLLIVIGFLLNPAPVRAACDMSEQSKGTTTVASQHACCIKKVTCACDAPGTPDAHNSVFSAANMSGMSGAGCACTVRPQPVHSAPASELLRSYVIAALPVRAGPIALFAFAASLAVPLPSATAPVAHDRFTPASPPRAPPF